MSASKGPRVLHSPLGACDDFTWRVVVFMRVSIGSLGKLREAASGRLFVARKDYAPVQVIAGVLGHVSASDIALIIHAWTLHHFVGGDVALEVRVGKLVLRLVAGRAAQTHPLNRKVPNLHGALAEGGAMSAMRQRARS